MNTLRTSIESKTISGNHTGTRTDNSFLSGYLLLGVTTILYAIVEMTETGILKDHFAIFFIHYFIGLAYVAILIFNRSFGLLKSWERKNIHKTIILLNIFLVSAYALNRELPVFEDSATWLCVYLVVSSVVLLSFRFFEILPLLVNRLQFFLLGSVLILYCYLALYVAEFYIAGGIGMIIFGIGAHILVPVFFIIGILNLIIFSTRTISRIWVIAGAVTTTCFAIGFVLEWNARIKKIESVSNQAVLYPDGELPLWVKIAQAVREDWITARILKSNLVYTVANNSPQWDFLPTRNWRETRKHDPLVYLASLNKKPSLSEDDRIKILLAMTDSRHKTEERLWSGDNLSTSYIVTDTDIYPDLRLAYTEKYFTIRNDLPSNRRWGTTEEAIYTFQLPEGSVVTSLSLWVNGKEEKAILTSKQKATEAYTTIVGKERRDPSVVHWQEGNTVSVRVFPCTPTEERKFKIGVTSPLSVQGNRVYYKGITFRGPNANKATEVFRVRFLGNPSELTLPGSFERNNKGEYVAEQEYDPDFALSFDVTPLKANEFNFGGYAYSLSEYHQAMKSIRFTSLYLDLNNSWTEDELDKLRSQLPNYQIYAHAGDAFILLDESNWTEITNNLRQRNFSVFPFHHVKDVETSLVVSKGRELSPYLRDFKESKFASGISHFFASGKKVYLYSLHGSTSTYIRSLKELRALEFADGDIKQLTTLLEKNEFPLSVENEQQIVLHDANAIISRQVASNNPAPNTGPDHLARLFAYNDIMRKVGSQFFMDDFINDALVDQAATAYVVSPVSSLIVLETKEDYDRFGINDKDNSLHNASKNSSGAVPEPHEWALIILFVLLVIYCLARQTNCNFNFSK